jgi:hypothetical protein
MQVSHDQEGRPVPFVSFQLTSLSLDTDLAFPAAFVAGPWCSPRMDPDVAPRIRRGVSHCR